MITDIDRIILEEIVNKEGNCLDGRRCGLCPFRRQCLPEFLKDPKNPPTKNQRFQMALDVIVNDVLMEDESTITENQQWFKKS